MKKLVVIAALAASLGGCATQFGQRIDTAIHHRRPIPVKAPARPAPVPAPVIVTPPPAPPPAPAPEKPKTFLERHPVKWLH